MTRHSHDVRVRLGDLTIWRVQCPMCKAVFTVLPHFVLRYRQMRPEVARNALLATHGGLSLELCAVICHLSPMALYRLVCALGQHSLVTVLTRCGLPLPAYFLADEKHSRCLVGRDRARYLSTRLPIPPVATVRAAFTAYGDPRRGFPAFVFRRHRQGFPSLRIRRSNYSQPLPVWPFPMYAAFPRSEYYGHADSLPMHPRTF